MMQEKVNRVLWSLIVFLKSKANQLNLNDVIELNRNLRYNRDKIRYNRDKIPDKIVAGYYQCITMMKHWNSCFIYYMRKRLKFSTLPTDLPSCGIHR